MDRSGLRNYPIYPVMSGAGEAFTLSFLLMTTTAGSLLLGLWSAGFYAGPNVWGFQQALFVALMDLVAKALSPYAVMLGMLAFGGVVGFTKCPDLRRECWLLVQLCALLFASGKRNLLLAHGYGEIILWRIATSIGLLVLIYLVLRLPWWVEMALRIRARRARVRTEAREDAGPSPTCPECDGPLDPASLVQGLQRCPHCGGEFNVEEI